MSVSMSSTSHLSRYSCTRVVEIAPYHTRRISPRIHNVCHAPYHLPFDVVGAASASGASARVPSSPPRTRVARRAGGRRNTVTTTASYGRATSVWRAPGRSSADEEEDDGCRTPAGAGEWQRRQPDLAGTGDTNSAPLPPHRLDQATARRPLFRFNLRLCVSYGCVHLTLTRSLWASDVLLPWV